QPPRRPGIRRNSLFLVASSKNRLQGMAGPGFKNSSPAAACRTGRACDESPVVADARRGRMRHSHGNDHSAFAVMNHAVAREDHCASLWMRILLHLMTLPSALFQPATAM